LKTNFSFIKQVGVIAALMFPMVYAAALQPVASRAPFSASYWNATTDTTDRLIIKYRNSSGAFSTVQAQTAMRMASNRQGVRLSHFRPMNSVSGAQVFRINRRMRLPEMRVMAANLRAADPNIEYAEPDRRMRPMMTPGDPLFSQQWSLWETIGGIRATNAWDKAQGQGVTVAVVDSGVRPHADLVANLLPGYDFIQDPTDAVDGNGRDSDASDPGDASAAGYCSPDEPAYPSSWHGTHVAGIIAAAANTTGITGVAYKARILPVRVLGRCGGYTSDIADGIAWAAGASVAGVPANPNPAKIINVSLGGWGSCDITTQNAINQARARGAVVVVAAGNESVNASLVSPASCTGVISVAATNRSGGRATYSNFGTSVTLAAPGGEGLGGEAVLSTLNTGTSLPGADSYGGYSGTSMATPAVSGVIALMLSVNRNLTPDQIPALLRSSARPFPTPCLQCGAGIVDANAAVTLAQSGNSGPPTPLVTAVNEVESNDLLGTAQRLNPLPNTVNGSIATSQDTDFYRVTLQPGQRIVATATGASNTALGFGTYTPDGYLIWWNQAGRGQGVPMEISNPATVPVVVLLRVWRTNGTLGTYRIDFQ
jgi:serine protease